jgi:hypothetical protein
MPGYGEGDITQDLEREVKDLRFQIEVLQHVVATGIAQRDAALSLLTACRAVLTDINTRLHGDEYDCIVTWQTERRMDTLLTKLDMKQEKTG